MEQYIKKSALVAEIDRQKIGYNTDGKHSVEYNTVKRILDIINTLEVKEVDLDEEFDKYCETLYLIDLENEPYAELFECAKHFFELGLNAQQKISYVQNIDDILKKEGLDPDSKEAKIFKESYYTAMEKLKAQKGE